MFNKRLILSSVLFATALALNDWSVPCTSGTCSYDTGDGVTTSWTTITLNGASTVLSDITSAAGWQISGCNAGWDSGVANVVITCAGTPEQMAQCAHLFEGGNAENKVVRLPQDCGVGPFARVVSASQIARRQDGVAETHAVALDYNFDQVADAGQGELSFDATASNVQSSDLDPSTLPALRSRGSLKRRLYPVAPRFDKSKTIDLPPLHVQKSIPLFNQTLDCPGADGAAGFSAAIGVDANVTVDVQASFGFAVSGSIFPLPKVKKFQLTGNLAGSAGADFDIDAKIHGSFDSGAIQLFQAGLPGFNFPGLLNVGPQFIVNGQVMADLGLEANIKTGLHWTFPSVQLVFPPDQGTSSAQADPAETPVSLSLASDVSVDGHITGHLIPRLEVGITVLQFAEANIFLDLDTSATLGLQASTAASVATDADSSTSVGGCATLDAGIDVRAGATGAIKPIFDKEIDFDIFKKDVNIFQKCFGSQAKRSTLAKRWARRATHAKRDLQCPSPGEVTALGDVVSL
ncbi:hypothetical protein EXIGLDRAFT_829503 [Exidia glandulosa HHB12029]|uniref:DUF7223 domain-containing protein n=1 Tax=Exidia glandulosa HHB12029 TaxID=1314781 RepID=A0A166BLW6_EXIGL|nr:hypothetical protein EXIGLDRAFT_829503 [Exidia glandulosa HHB12029]